MLCSSFDLSFSSFSLSIDRTPRMTLEAFSRTKCLTASFPLLTFAPTTIMILPV